MSSRNALHAVAYVLTAAFLMAACGGNTAAPTPTAGIGIPAIQASAAASEYPNPQLTPGAVLTADASTVCKPGYSSTVRNVSTAMKRQVTEEYGFSYPVARDHEIDHLVSLELGGSNDLKNLWLQFGDLPHNYHHKDALEDKMHTLVCNGRLALTTAQAEIVQDWEAAYIKYVGPF